MNIQDSWEKAFKITEIIRPRVKPLETFQATHLPYIFLAESTGASGDTIVKKGEVTVERPALVLPYGLPQFMGFNLEEEMGLNEDFLASFFLVRGVSFPSMKYSNSIASTDVYKGKLSEAIAHYSQALHREEDVHSGLVTGSLDCWQFSIMIFIGSQMMRSADGDFRKLFEDFQRRGLMS